MIKILSTQEIIKKLKEKGIIFLNVAKQMQKNFLMRIIILSN